MLMAAIHEAEKHTSGEIVLVISRQSGDYRAASLAFSAVLAFSASLPLWLYLPGFSFFHLWLAQVGLFIFSALGLEMTGASALLAAPSIRRKAAARQAREQFHRQGIHTTSDRAGMLLFLSLKEHYAEILPDLGIAGKESETTWHSIIEALTTQMQAGHLTEACLQAIEACAEILARHYPPRPQDQNELPNAPAVV